MSAGAKADPGVLAARVSFEGRTYMLALVRTFWATEGACIFEALNVAGTDAVAVEFGTWHIKSSDEGPTTLFVDVEIPSDLTSNTDELLRKLLDVATELGASWGLQGHLEAAS